MSHTFKVGDYIKVSSRSQSSASLTPGRAYRVTDIDVSDDVRPALVMDDNGHPGWPRNPTLVAPLLDTATAALVWLKARYVSHPQDREVLGAMLSDVFSLVATPETTFTFGPSPF